MGSGGRFVNAIMNYSDGIFEYDDMCIYTYIYVIFQGRA